MSGAAPFTALNRGDITTAAMCGQVDLTTLTVNFLYFAAGIGATSQTADVNIRSKEIRRIATAHSLISFAFNTAILATMINLAAGLF